MKEITRVKESKDETGRNTKRRRKETGEETKKEKAEEEEEEKDKEVEKDVMGWTLVTRSTKQRTKMIQIFVEVHGSRTVAMEVAPNDKVGDMMKRKKNGGDMYVTSGGRVLRRSEE